MNRMEGLVLEGNTKMAPNLIIYNTLIKVIEKCPGVLDKVVKARGVLHDMMTKATGEIRPNTRSFNAVLLACGASVEARGREAVHGVDMTLTELRQDPTLSNDAYTYPAVFKAYAKFRNVVPRELVERAFHWCCEDRCMDSLTLKHLKNATTLDHLQRLLGMEDVSECTLHQLPRRWRPRRRARTGKGKR